MTAPEIVMYACSFALGFWIGRALIAFRIVRKIPNPRYLRPKCGTLMGYLGNFTEAFWRAKFHRCESEEL